MEELYEGDGEIREDLVRAATLVGREELKQRLSRLDRPAKKVYLKKWTAAAAVVVALIAAVFLMKPSSSDALYAAHYSKLPNNVVPITRGDSGNNVLKRAMIPYETADYDSALAEINNLGKDFPELKVFRGAIAMEEERYSDAVIVLFPLSQDKAYKFNNEASWYLALAYLKLDNQAKATELLQTLSAGDSIYSKKASALLEDLN